MGEMTIANTRSQNDQLFLLISFALVGAMLACMVITAVQFVEALYPQWSGEYLVGFCFLVALESMYTRYAFRRIRFPDVEWIFFRSAEWIVILATLKVVSYLPKGIEGLLSEVSLWRKDFIDSFFTNEYFFALVVVIIVWVFANLFASDLMHLHVEEHTLRLEQESGMFEQRSNVRARMAKLILYIGGVMIVFTAMMRTELVVDWFNLPLVRSGVYNLLVYFFLGLVFLSLTQLSVLRARWLIEHIPVNPRVTGNWFLYSFIFILGLAIIASLLPTNYSLGLLTVLNYLFRVVLAVIGFLLMILITPLFFLLTLLSVLFGMQAPSEEPLSLPDTLTIPPPGTPGSPVAWFEVLKSLIFWAILLGVVGFSFYYYIRQHKGLGEALRRLPFATIFLRFWDWLRGIVGGVNRQVNAMVDAGMQRLRNRREHLSERPWRYFNLRRLSPRERVWFYYLAMVRRIGEQGFAREASQTPYEYSQTLSNAFRAESGAAEILTEQTENKMVERVWAEALESSSMSESAYVVEDINALTEQFVEARYSQHEVTIEQADTVKRYWERIKRALRRTLRGGKE